MPTNKDGVMIILSSPSGAGKTTLVNLLSQNPNFEISISHTTRKPRQSEVNNKDYYFVGDQEFKRLIKNGNFWNTQKYLIIIMELQERQLLINLTREKLFFLT